MKILVFVEHHRSEAGEGELQKGSLGILSMAAGLGAGDVSAVVLGAGVESFAGGAGRYGAATVFVGDDQRLEAPLPQPRVDALARLVEQEGFDAVLFAQSILSADIAAGLSARLESGLNWQLVDLAVDGDALVGKQSALGDSVLVNVGWTSTPRLALFRAGIADPVESGGDARVERLDLAFEEHSLAAEML